MKNTFLFLLFVIYSTNVYPLSDFGKPSEAQAVNLFKFWSDGDYLRVQTYDGHSSSGRNYAADFYFNSRNRPDIYKNSESGTGGRSMKAPVSGNVFLHLLDVTGLGSGQFPFINAVQVFNGNAAIPQTCFSMTDSLGSTINIDLSFVIDFNSNSSRTLFSHLQTDNSFFTSSVITKIRSAVRKFYNRTAVGSPRRVAVSTGFNISTGGSVGTIGRWGIAQDFHIHFQFFTGSSYSETSPYLGSVQDLSNSSNITIEGQTILSIPFEVNASNTYQFPSMTRRTFLSNDYIIVNTSWDGGSGANLRSSPGGTVIQYYANTTIGQIINAVPQKAIYNSEWYLWYNVRFGNQTGWMAAIYFDKTTSTNISKVSFATPKEYMLYQNYPNPFNPKTKIRFELPVSSLIEIKIANIQGKTVCNQKENLSQGIYEYEFDGSNISSGVYFLHLRTESYNKTLKLILNK